MLKQIGRYQFRRELSSDVLLARYAAVSGKGPEERSACVLVGKMPVRLAPEEAELFRVEAEATRALSEEHVLRVLEHGVQHGMPYVAHAPGSVGSLAELLASGPSGRRAVPRSAACALALDVCEALIAAHGCRPPLLHRAVSPQTVLLDGDGRARLAGYALAGVCIEAARKSPAMAKMALRQAPPELVANAPLGPGADLFGLGVVLVSALLGRLPDGGAEALSGGALDATLAEVTVGPELRELLGRLLAADAGARGAAIDARAVLSGLAGDLDGARKALADALDVEPPADAEAGAEPGLLHEVTKETALPDALRVLAPERPTPSPDAVREERARRAAAASFLGAPPPAASGRPRADFEHDGATLEEPVRVPVLDATRVEVPIQPSGELEEEPTLLERSAATALLRAPQADAAPAHERTVQLDLSDVPSRGTRPSTQVGAPAVKAIELTGRGAGPASGAHGGVEHDFERPVSPLEAWLREQSKVEVGGWPLPWLVALGVGALFLVLFAASIGVWLAS